MSEVEVAAKTAKKKSGTKYIAVRIPPSLLHDLDAYVSRRRRTNQFFSRSDVVRDALANALKKETPSFEELAERDDMDHSGGPVDGEDA